MDLDLTVELDYCWELGRRGQIKSALEKAVQLRLSALSRDDSRTVANASAVIAWFSFQLGEVESGIEHAYASKAFWAEARDLERTAWAGSIYAWLLLEAGLTEEAADEAVKALSLAEQADHAVTLSWALNVLGVIFWTCKQLDRAHVLCERAVGLARASKDANLISWWLINLGGVHLGMGNRMTTQGNAAAAEAYQIALSIFDEALIIAREIGDTWSLRIALSHRAECCIAAGDLPTAALMLAEWDALRDDGGSRTVAQYLYTKGQLLTKQGRLMEALSVCTNALVLAQSIHNVESETFALRYLSEIYEALQRFESALIYFKRFHEAQGRLAAETTQRRARFAEIHYETERFKRLAERASERADQMAVTTMLDPLTGIGNRRQLEKTFEALRAGTQRYAVAVVDLDHFKMINDKFSHMVGDDVLKRLADVLTDVLRASDIVVRLGGEEFVVVMHGIGIEDATSVCVHLNAQIAKAPWSEIASGLRVTASIGVAAGDAASDPSVLLEVADRRLYAAKAAGRNRTVGASIIAANEDSPDFTRLPTLQALGLSDLANAVLVA